MDKGLLWLSIWYPFLHHFPRGAPTRAWSFLSFLHPSLEGARMLTAAKAWAGILVDGSSAVGGITGCTGERCCRWAVEEQDV